MNIYEMTIQKFSEFTGSKLTIWESEKSKVWMESDKNFDVYVYVLKNGKVSARRWMIGSLVYSNGVMRYQLNSEYKLKTDYAAWVKQVSA
ncbi:MAG: hypothetical protein WC449_05130 [Candidatus Paceibacterota bacterium]